MSKEKAKKITDCIYEAYGSDTGYLLGIHPESRPTVETIVESTLKVLEFWRKKQECSGKIANTKKELERIIEKSELYIDDLDLARGYAMEAEVPRQVGDLAQAILDAGFTKAKEKE